MKVILLLLILSSFVMLFGQTGFSSTVINPSSTALAMGDVTGVADVWSGDPLNVWSNPALVAFHEGVRVGYTHIPREFEYGKDYYSSTYASIARNGLGISFPLLNYNGKFGTTYDYDTSQSSETYLYETSSEFSIAYDPFVRLQKQTANLFIQSFNASFGLSLNMLSYRWNGAIVLPDIFGQGDSQEVKADVYPLNAGILFALDGGKYFQMHDIDFQATLGWQFKNITDARFRYDYQTDEHNSTIIPTDNRLGGGLYIGLPSDIAEESNTFYTSQCNHWISALFTVGSVDSQYGYDETGHGLEIGLFDILFFRSGQHEVVGISDPARSTGWGLRFYHDYNWDIRYNAAWYSVHNENIRSWDLSFAYHFPPEN